MIVTLIKENRIFCMTLPEKINGQYWISDIDEDNRTRNLISVEAVYGEWLVKSNKLVSILDLEGQQISNVVLKPLNIFNLVIKNNDERVLVFSEPNTESRQCFAKYTVTQPCDITIGRSADNCIVYGNKYVSSKHAKLNYDGTNWTVIDVGSANGTYVNGCRVQSLALKTGNSIYIMGLKIIIGVNFLAINNPDDGVKVNESYLHKFETQKPSARKPEEDEHIREYFYRSPRFKREVETAQIKIDPPPAPLPLEKTPLALMIGPSITMGMTSLATGLITIMNTANNGGNITSSMPTLLMCVGMLLSTVMWPVLTKNQEKKTRIRNEKKRQEKYFSYLASIRDEIKRECKEQAEILNENIISTDECMERITSVKRSLWERMLGQNDFLLLRVGIGNLPLDVNIKFPDKKFTMEDDHLQDAMFSLGTEPKQLVNVPVSVSFTEHNIIGMIGNRAEVINLAKCLILQAIALHSYDELKLVLIADKDEMPSWDFLRWVPHAWNNEKNIRYIANSNDDIKELSIILEDSILNRNTEQSKTYRDYSPYYFIISANKELSNRCEAINQLLKSKNNGFSFIMMYDELKNLPKETQTVIEVSKEQSKIYSKDDISGKNTMFKADRVDEARLSNIAVSLANIHLDLSSQRYSLPGMISFLEMFQVGKIEHLNSLTRWKENNPTVTLQTPIGVDTAGEPFYLDLHEKFHGPHGLVAGMTGSGKSEFIITYILSLAVNYHPNEVAFILIDYKGGGLTGAFENEERGIKLPHLAGTITNLDGAAVKRSLISIQSELRRRQAIFNEARRITNEGTMDIYKYQQLYREKIVKEPVPHLLIISDEFAELKAQQPEFMEQLISAARIGRSLGVHLILATQKPSGVVDDQIWSNSKFRVCLKVQEKADSMDMIKCPDAAQLSNTGRFYLQVGFNELFALGQSAWSGERYIPSETVEKHIDSSIQIVNNLGGVIKDIKPTVRAVSSTSKTKQIVAVVKYLSDLAVSEHIKIRPLWQPPIPAFIYVDLLEEKYQHQSVNAVLNPVVGEYDDPFNQNQNLLTLPLSRDGNCVVYGSTGSGKATFLTTVVYSLIKNHDSRFLNIYIMDFGAETLRAFEKAPQVGGVLCLADSEKVINLFKMLAKEIEKRKRLFADYGGDYESYTKNTGRVVSNIVVILNNYSGFSEQFEGLEEQFSSMTRDGIKYGIYFIVSAGSTNAIRYRVLQNFKMVLTLQLNDPSDYPVIVGKTDGLVPSKQKGRGLVSLNACYEFQTAYCSDCEDQYEFIRKYSTGLRSSTEYFAFKVPVLPDIVDYTTLQKDVSTIAKLPVGIGKKSLTTSFADIQSKYLYPVSAQDSNLLEGVAQGIAEIIAATGTKTIVLDAQKGFASQETNTYEYFDDGFELVIQDLFAQLAERNNLYKESKMELQVLEPYREVVCIILGFKKMNELLSADGKDKLKVLLEKGEAFYKVHFVMIESYSQLNGFALEPWYKKNFAGTDGIWIGDGIADQYLLRPGKITSDLYEEIDTGFGYVVTKNRPLLVKLVTVDKVNKEADGDE